MTIWAFCGIFYHAVETLHSIILGIVQGLTEFLPVSSSGHLALLENAFGIKGKLTLTVMLHFGSALALLVVLWRDIVEILTKNRKVIWLLIVGSIPAGVLGLLFKSKVAVIFDNPFFVGIFLVITGVILWLTKCVSEKRDKIGFRDAIIIGIAQAIAILPGISRSGITIAAGIYLGLNRVQAAKFSFLLAIISILGATVIQAKDAVMGEISALPLLLGIIISFFASLLAIKVLLRIVRSKWFSLFAIYCWVLGFLTMVR